jgi:hypothetical protein
MRDTTTVSVVTDNDINIDPGITWLPLFNRENFEDSNHYFCRTELLECSWYLNTNYLNDIWNWIKSKIQPD